MSSDGSKPWGQPKFLCIVPALWPVGPCRFRERRGSQSHMFSPNAVPICPFHWLLSLEAHTLYTPHNVNST